jgi:ABC-type nitrate/sulfonate/bicarbonate transport system permease component
MTSLSRRAPVWGLRLLLVGALVGGWWYGTGPGGISRLVLPPLSEVGAELVALPTSGFVVRAALVTLTEIVLALVIAAVVGLSVGFFLSRTRLRTKAAEPALAWAYMFPLVLLYPLFLLWMGVGMGSKVAYGAVAASIPIAYNTLRGLANVDPRYVKVGTAFGASKVDMDLHVKAGAARPMILSGIRVGVSLVLISVVFAELLGSNVGLGYEIQRASNTFQYARAYALILVIVFLAAVVQQMVEKTMIGRRS